MSITLRCLSVKQPWATAIVLGWKPWENRPQRRNYRGPLLIQAGREAVPDFAECVETIERLSGQKFPGEFKLGGLVGAVNLVGCADPLDHDDGKWRYAGQYGLELERAVTLPFRRIRGALGLFNVEITPSEAETLRTAGLLPA